MYFNMILTLRLFTFLMIKICIHELVHEIKMRSENYDVKRVIGREISILVITLRS